MEVSAADAASVPRHRPDRRKPDDLRPPMAELGPLNRTDGSARFAHGNTTVLAAIYGPGAPRFSRKEKIEGATIEVTCHPHKGQTTSADKERELYIRGVLEEAILTVLHPRTAIHIIVQIYEDDGCALSAAINAASLAVLNAGLDMAFVPTSITIAVRADGKLLADPTAAEEKAARATAALTLSSVDWGLVSSKAVGPMHPSELMAALALAQGGARLLLSFIRRTVEEHTRRTTKLEGF